MEKLVIRIGRFIETVTACLLMVGAFPVARHWAILGLILFFGGMAIIWADFQDRKEGGER